MAREPWADIFDRLTDTWEPVLRRAFEEAVAEITNAAEIMRLVERLERGDINGAIDALHIDPAAYRGMEEAIRQAYAAGGDAAVLQMPVLRDPDGAKLIIRFGLRNERAETWVRNQSGNLITRIVKEQRLVAREQLEAGLQRGDNPRTTALDLVGRVDRVTNMRTGGTLGLTAPQMRYVQNARAELASGDPEAMTRYLKRERRDKRFDRTIAKAIKEGRTLTKQEVTKITARYSDALLNLRGEMVARTETIASLNAANMQAYQQAIDEGKLQAGAVTKAWRAGRDERTRLSHNVLHGQTVGFNEAFVSPLGSRMMHPGDTSLGASAADIVLCRCRMLIKGNRLAGVR